MDANLMSKFDVSLKARPIQTLQEHEVCGDKGFYTETDTHLFVGLCDGAGHGIKAAEVSNLAIDYMKSNHELALDTLLENLHQALNKTRGGAISVGKIDKHSLKLIYSGIGNISARIFNEDNKKLITRDGVIGYKTPKPKIVEKQLKEGDIIVLYSDGVKDRLSPEDFPELNDLTAEEISIIIIDYFSKTLDDASCITVKVLHD